MIDRRPRARTDPRRSGFTLIEAMIVVTILGILALIAVPNYVRYQRAVRIGATIAELKGLSHGFLAYSVSTGRYPPESEGGLSASMSSYIPPETWSRETPLGGNYEWEGPDAFPYAGIAIAPAGAVQLEALEILDRNLDDGDLSSGKFRIGTSGRPTYVLTE